MRALIPYSRIRNSRARPLYIAAVVLGTVFLGALIGVATAVLPSNLIIIPAGLVAATALIAIWALPDFDHGPDKYFYWSLLAFALVFGVWPPYVSIILPGLPWMSVTRIIMLFLLMFAVLSFSMSRATKSLLSENLVGSRALIVAMVILHIAQFVSIPLSSLPVDSLKLFIRYQIFTVFIFFAVLATIRDRRKIGLIAMLLMVGALTNGLLSPIEARLESNLWLTFMPPGFGVDSELMARILDGARRAGRYRVSGSFVTSLENAEYLVMAVPFAAYLVLDQSRPWLKLLGILAIPIMMTGVYFAGSRLGWVAFIMAGGTYIFLWGIRRWRLTQRSGLLGPALITMFPAGVVAMLITILSSRTLTRMIFGGGEHQASNEGRIEQLESGIPIIMRSPLFGHGHGMGALKLGYTTPGGFLTIDSYLLSVALETGFVGLFAFVAMLGIGIWQSGKVYVTRKTEEAAFGAFVSSSLAAFFMIKIILSQYSNHTVPYIFLAMTVLLVSGQRGDAKENRAAEEEEKANS